MDSAPNIAQPATANADFTPAQLQTMANWAVQDGTLSREQANAMLAADNAPANANTSPPSNDQPVAPVELSGLPPIDLSDPTAQAEHASYMDVPRDGKPYDFNLPHAGVNGEFVTEMQGLCKALELPGWMGKYISTEYVKAEQAYFAGQLTPANIALQKSKAEFTLKEMWGSEYSAKVSAAQSVINSLPPAQRERAAQILEDSGLGNNPLILSHFATLAQHRAARKGK